MKSEYRKAVCAKAACAMAVLFISSCGAGKDSDVTPNTGTPANAGATDNTLPTDVPQIAFGTAQYGYSVSRPLTTTPPDDLADYYNLFWFNPDTFDNSQSDEPNSISDIRFYADYETSFGFALRTLDEAIHQAASEIYNTIDTGGTVSDNEVENTLAIQFHQRVNDCNDVVFDGGYISSYSCAINPAFFYHAPGGGKLLVELSYKNSNSFHLSVGNDENQHPGLGYGVWYALSLQGTRVFAQHTYPGAELWTVSTIPGSKVTGDIKRDTQLLRNMETAVRGLLSNEYNY